MAAGEAELGALWHGVVGEELTGKILKLAEEVAGYERLQAVWSRFRQAHREWPQGEAFTEHGCHGKEGALKSIKYNNQCVCQGHMRLGGNWERQAVRTNEELLLEVVLQAATVIQQNPQQQQQRTERSYGKPK